MTARGRTDGTQAQTAPAAHTVELVRADDGVLQMRHTECGGTWTMPVEVVVGSVTMLDQIHSVIDHRCAAPAPAALKAA